MIISSLSEYVIKYLLINFHVVFPHNTNWLIQGVGQEGHESPYWAKVPQQGESAPNFGANAPAGGQNAQNFGYKNAKIAPNFSLAAPIHKTWISSCVKLTLDRNMLNVVKRAPYWAANSMVTKYGIEQSIIIILISWYKHLICTK